ncbi:MAG: DUF6265 family protein [Gemmatimonadales bacterium]
MLAVVMLLMLPAAASAQAELLRQAGWLGGCWESRSGTRVTHEFWMPAAGDLMVGGGRTLVGDAARGFEHLRLHAREGRLTYTAIPSGQAETAFTSITVSDSLLVFENLQHDFPQRIAYRRTSADSITARVEGPGPAGATRGFELRFARMACT